MITQYLWGDDISQGRVFATDDYGYGATASALQWEEWILLGSGACRAIGNASPPPISVHRNASWNQCRSLCELNDAYYGVEYN